MPIYDLICSDCKYEQQDKYISRAFVDTNIQCPKCQGTMKKMLTSANPTGIKGYPYYDSIFECEVESPDHRRQLMKKHNLRELEMTPDRCKGKWV